MQGLSIFAESAPLAIGSALVLGLVIGSFLNVVIARLPQMMENEWQDQANELRGEPLAERERFNLVTPRSRCPSCGHAIGALENIPLVSWVVLRGRCSACGSAISPRYPVVELMSGVLCALAAWRYGASVQGVAAMVLTFFLITLAFIDLDTQLLPDSMTMPLLWLGLALNLWGVFAPLDSAVIGAIAGYLLLWSVYWLFKLVTGKEGMGYGDFKLLAALGAWFGWQLLPSIILLASVVGAAVGVSLIVFRKHGREVPIPFGPYLAGAGLLALYLGKPLSGLFGIA
ncbi:MAG TPA: A24 family peptidase [Burkholderiaceae bacterium]